MFQGDSITDMGRGRTEDPNHILGHGYAFLIAAREGADYPDQHLTFINRGISGNETSDLLKRWQSDTIDLKPDVLSILIGVNDLWHAIKADKPFSVADYEQRYDQILSQTVKALPKVKLVICEPFFVSGKGTEMQIDRWKETMPQVDAVVEKLAAKYHAPVVHFQKIFDKATRRAPIDYWIWDGVHPTYAGHQLMADEWKRAYREFYKSFDKAADVAPTPPMGWNSYDAFGDSVTEGEVLANAQYMKDQLLAHDWKYVIIDARWYDPEPTGDDFAFNKRTGAKLTSDKYGRLLPARNRFHSAGSESENGFKPLADRLHAMGLKFGLHSMRGIPRQSVLAKVPIANSRFTAAEAGDPKSTCVWCPDTYGVLNNDAGQAWYDALLAQWASWGVDYIKIDDLSVPYNAHEVEQIRRAIDKCGRAIVFSTSPGPTEVEFAKHISVNANLWRVSGDFWDTWPKLDKQFDLLNNWKGIGGVGHWPDVDMIPFGHICIRSKAGGTDRRSRYTQDEQRTLMSLWCLASSPLMLGGNLPDNTDWDLSLLTNDEVLAVNQDSLGRPAVRLVQSATAEHKTEVWVKELRNGSWAAGLFNRGDAEVEVAFNFANANLQGPLNVYDLWSKKEIGPFKESISIRVPAHGVALLRLTQ